MPTLAKSCTGWWFVGLDLGNGDAALQNFSEFIFLTEECLWGCESSNLAPERSKGRNSVTHLEVFLDLQLFTAPFAWWDEARIKEQLVLFCNSSITAASALPDVGRATLQPLESWKSPWQHLISIRSWKINQWLSLSSVITLSHSQLLWCQG